MRDHGLTQQQVANAAGVRQSAVSQWLSGAMPGAAELHKFAKANGVSVSCFLDAEKSDLTEKESIGNIASVKRSWENLLADLHRATNAAGKMSELRDFLTMETGRKVPLASVSRWLADKREPGARITMLMLKWVEREMGK